MIDENIIREESQAGQLIPVKDDPERALTGKIANLPYDIRTELNQRILDGKNGSEILPWLNALPAVQQVLAARFKGIPVSDQNLTNWRQDGYQRWLKERCHIDSAEKLGEYAASFTKAAGGRFAPAAAAAASAKIFEFLNAANAENANPDELVRCAGAAFALLKGDQNNTKLELARERIRQKDEQILIMRDKFQRDCVGLVMHALGDARSKEIEASTLNNVEKIELLGIHLFDDLWEPRPIPTPENSSALPPPNQ
jgi:hypothetical protein